MKNLLENIKQTRKAASQELTGNPRTSAGHDMVRRQARAKLPELEKELMAQFKKVGFPVFVSGPDAVAYTDLAKEAAEVVVVDFRQATKDIRHAIKAGVGTPKDFSINAFTLLIRSVRQLGADLGLTSVPDFKYDGSKWMKDEETMHSVIDSYLLKYLGPDFLAAMLERAAVREAEKLDCESPLIPVLVLNLPKDAQDKMAPLFFQGKFTEVNATDGVDSAFVTKTFKAIRKVVNSSLTTKDAANQTATDNTNNKEEN